MDIKQYIASGIIESYILGTASEQERQEVECMSHIYPEVNAELRDSEKVMEKFASSIAVAPPAHIKANVLNQVATTEQEKATFKDQPQGKVIPLTTERNKPNKRLLISLVASITLLVGLGVSFFVLNQKHTQLQANLENKNQKIETLQSDYDKSIADVKNTLNESLAIQKLLLNTDTKTIPLGGTDLSPNATAKVYFNPKSTEIVYHNESLPTPEATKQYQLWAIADGVPVDLGVIAKDGDIYKTKVPASDNIQAFAITLEPNGGSETPTLEQMYVIGNV